MPTRTDGAPPGSRRVRAWWARCVGAVAFAGALAGCPDLPGHRCATSRECGQGGVCERAGVCSFPVAACDSGRGYADQAAGDLAGTCVPSCDAAGGDAACLSGVCEAGQCVPDDEVRYVAEAGVDTAACTQADPCRTIARAIAARGARALVVVTPGTYVGSIEINPPAQADAPFDVWLIGARGPDGARPVVRASDGDGITIHRGGLAVRALEVHDGAAVTTSDTIDARDATRITISDSRLVAATGNALECHGCTVTVRRSEVRGDPQQGIWIEAGRDVELIGNTVTGNREGGLAITADRCVIGSNLIVGNGHTGSDVGGASVSCPLAHAFVHNTLSQNQAADPSVAAYRCLSGASAVNDGNLFDAAATAVTGCEHSYSLTTSGLLPGHDNRTATPGFVSPTDLHLRPDSPARGAASPTAPTQVDIDIDGEARRQGAGDIGADEIP